MKWRNVCPPSIIKCFLSIWGSHCDPNLVRKEITLEMPLKACSPLNETYWNDRETENDDNLDSCEKARKTFDVRQAKEKHVRHPCPPCGWVRLCVILSSTLDTSCFELQGFPVTLVCSTAHHAIWSPCPRCCSAAFYLPNPEFLEHFFHQLLCTLFSISTQPHPMASFSNSLNFHLSRTLVGILLLPHL